MDFIEDKNENDESVKVNNDNESNIAEGKTQAQKANKTRINWTACNVFMTAVMAIAAIIAARFTYIYVNTTRDILNQARIDSKLEYRPYISAKVDTTKLSFNFEKKQDIIFANSDFNIRLLNSGRSPATNLRSLHVITHNKKIDDSTIASLQNHLEKSPTHSAVTNMNEFIMKASVSLKSTNDYSNGYYIVAGIEQPLDVTESGETTIYYHLFYSYGSIGTEEFFDGHLTLGLKFNFKIKRLHIYVEAYTVT